MILRQAGETEALKFYAADLLKDEGWVQAAKGCDFVIHTASPMPIGEYKGQDLVTPAREGTRRVLAAAKSAGAKRVVMTSSTVAAMPPVGKDGRIDETNWTERPEKPIYEYSRSKVLAERDAWNFVKDGGGTPELVVLLPAMIQGPILGAHSSSGGIVGMMLHGKMPVVPRVGFSLVDVRDLADLHVRAMISPAAAGERFIAAGDFLWLSEIASLLRREFGDMAHKAPKRVLPDWIVKFGALFGGDLALLASDLGLRRVVDAGKAERVLDWKTRPARQSIIDAAKSIIGAGAT
jgi:dihydroflavonol-4-reductase